MMSTLQTVRRRDFGALALNALSAPVLGRAEANVQAVAASGLMLARACLRERKGNAVMSPSGLVSMLLMLCLGARGDSRSQLLQALGLEGAGAEESALRSLGAWLQASGGLRWAQALRASKRSDFQPSYLSRLAAVFDAQLFESGNQAQLQRWIAERSGGQLDASALPPEPGRHALTLLSLNAISQPWRVPFEPSQTYPGLFTAPGQEARQAQLMRGVKEALFQQDGLATRIRLALADPALEVWCLLPQDRQLDPLELNLFADPTLAWQRQMIDISLPRLRIESRGELSAALKRQGIAHLFEAGKADLSAASAVPGVHVQALHQAAVIELKESGVSAASLTTSILVGSLPAQRTIAFNRPFLLALVGAGLPDQPVHFLARVAGPS